MTAQTGRSHRSGKTFVLQTPAKKLGTTLDVASGVNDNNNSPIGVPTTSNIGNFKAPVAVQHQLTSGNDASNGLEPVVDDVSNSPTEDANNTTAEGTVAEGLPASVDPSTSTVQVCAPLDGGSIPSGVKLLGEWNPNAHDESSEPLGDDEDSAWAPPGGLTSGGWGSSAARASSTSLEPPVPSPQVGRSIMSPSKATGSRVDRVYADNDTSDPVAKTDRKLVTPSRVLEPNPKVVSHGVMKRMPALMDEREPGDESCEVNAALGTADELESSDACSTSSQDESKPKSKPTLGDLFFRERVLATMTDKERNRVMRRAIIIDEAWGFRERSCSPPRREGPKKKRRTKSVTSVVDVSDQEMLESEVPDTDGTEMEMSKQEPEVLFCGAVGGEDETTPEDVREGAPPIVNPKVVINGPDQAGPSKGKHRDKGERPHQLAQETADIETAREYKRH